MLILYRWDDWVPQDRLRKYNDENLELSKNLRQEMNAQRRAAAKPMTATVTRKRDLNTGSARGSEERTAPAAPTRGTKRGREYEGIDKVSDCFLHVFVFCEFCVGVWSDSVEVCPSDHSENIRTTGGPSRDSKDSVRLRLILIAFVVSNRLLQNRC